MTDLEKKRYRGELLVDLEDAESALAYLRDRALSVAGEFESIAKKLRFSVEVEPSHIDFTSDGDVQVRLTPDQIARFETVQAVSAIIEDMKEARQHLFNLQQRKQRLSGF